MRQLVEGMRVGWVEHVATDGKSVKAKLGGVKAEEKPNALHCTAHQQKALQRTIWLKLVL